MKTTPTVPIPARRAAARARTLATVSSLAAATALLATLSACGGGGGGESPTPPPPAPTPSPSPAPTGPIAAQMTVPTPVGYDAERLAAFNRLNEIRLSAGLGMVAQNTLMDQAAQAHADWMIANNLFTHDEQIGTAGFTGTNWARRDESFGYVPASGSEVMAANTGGADGVDLLVNTLYHRSAILAIEPVDVGVGWTNRVATGFSTPLVIDLTRPGIDVLRGLGQQGQTSINGVSIWPLDGASNVPIRLGDESPNPVPSQDVLTLGTPASVTVDRLRTIQVISFSMTNSATGTVVATTLLTNQNDSNFLVPSSFVAIVPLVTLDVGATYRVDFRGTAIAFPSGEVVGIDRTWSFGTASR